MSAQLAALRQKGLTVVAAQGAVIDSRSFQEWKGWNASPFPVGRVAERSEQTAWVTGLASLPWLVLTDAQGRIAAEGLDLEEIDAKLQAMDKWFGGPQPAPSTGSRRRGPNLRPLSRFGVHSVDAGVMAYGRRWLRPRVWSHRFLTPSVFPRGNEPLSEGVSQ